VSGLEYSCGVVAQVVGKPCREFFLAAVEELSVEPEECVMIGDVGVVCLNGIRRVD
jgi:phospholysine phosphohistidine inorganic pyrophosphate phosphatase